MRQSDGWSFRDDPQTIDLFFFSGGACYKMSLVTLHGTEYTVLVTRYRVYSPQPTVHSTQHTVHSTRYSVPMHSTHHEVRSTQYSVH